VSPALTAAPSPSRPADPRWLALDRQLCFALYSASLAMTKLYKPLLSPLGLTYPQYLVLLVLWERDACTVSALGDRLHLDSGTLTPLLKRMAASGWLTRERDAADERCVRLRLTPDGRALQARAAAIPPQILCASACNLEHIHALTQQLQQLRQSLSDAASPTPIPSQE
jgi:MarR family transcriptional regulator, organic hydroperoxide resistance regulator